MDGRDDHEDTDDDTSKPDRKIGTVHEACGSSHSVHNFCKIIMTKSLTMSPNVYSTSKCQSITKFNKYEIWHDLPMCRFVEDICIRKG